MHAALALSLSTLTRCLLRLRQVIALLCHLVQAEAGLARGPFLVVVPSSVLPNWAAELARWAPTLSVVTYAGPEPARAATYAQTIARGRFQVCLTTFEMMMGVKDVPRLSRVKWAYLVMDEAREHRPACLGLLWFSMLRSLTRVDAGLCVRRRTASRTRRAG
jgi:SNF2 family DNA or RNA helicase